MPHIHLADDLTGMRSLLDYRPETARPLTELAEVLLRGPSSLTRGERELIATRVAHLNRSRFFTSSHAAFAAAQLPEGMALVDQVRADPATAPVPDKLRALLAIADAVHVGGQEVQDKHVEAARSVGATDVEIHDAVLIAAAFCMYSRYADGLSTIAPDEPEAYAAMAERVLQRGYQDHVPQPRRHD